MLNHRNEFCLFLPHSTQLLALWIRFSIFENCRCCCFFFGHFIHFSMQCNAIAGWYSSEIECCKVNMSILFYESKCTILVLIIRYMHLNKWTGLIKAWNTIFNFTVVHVFVCSIATHTHTHDKCEPFNQFIYCMCIKRAHERSKKEVAAEQARNMATIFFNFIICLLKCIYISKRLKLQCERNHWNKIMAASIETILSMRNGGCSYLEN